MLAPLEVIGRFILYYIQSIWELLLSIFSTSATTKASPLDTISSSEQYANIIVRSESQGEIPHVDGYSEMDGGTSSEAIPTASSNLLSEPPSKSLVADSQSSAEDSDDTSGDSDTAAGESESVYYFRLLPEVCQSMASAPGQLDNMLPGHHISQSHDFCLD